MSMHYRTVVTAFTELLQIPLFRVLQAYNNDKQQQQ
jgi:hypothetical protein